MFFNITIQYIGLSLCLIVFCYWGIPFIHSKYSILLLRIKTIKQKVIVLTFDDGPSSGLTPVMLSILAKYNVKATFFLLGKNISGNESVVKRIEAEGHEICSHGYEHLDHSKISPSRSLSDLKNGWETINKVLQRNGTTYPFRPPYGRMNLFCLVYLLIRKVPIIYWTLNSGDTWLPKDRRDSKRAVLLAKEMGGAVILAHDRERSNEDRAFVLDAIERVVIMARKNNITTSTVSRFLNY